MCPFWQNSLFMVCSVMLGHGVFVYTASRIAFYVLPGNMRRGFNCRAYQKQSSKNHIWKPIPSRLPHFLFPWEVPWEFHLVTCIVMSFFVFFYLCHWRFHFVACLVILVLGLHLFLFSSKIPFYGLPGNSWHSSVCFIALQDLPTSRNVHFTVCSEM